MAEWVAENKKIILHKNLTLWVYNGYKMHKIQFDKYIVEIYNKDN